MSRPIAIHGARLVDPASGRDETGDVIVIDGRIADLGPGLVAGGVPDGTERIDAAGSVCAPGLVDMRIHGREPGAEHMETLGTAAAAAAAGGVTTVVCLPDTHPTIDDVALVEFIKRRRREIDLVNIHTYAAVTKGLDGVELTEMGLLSEAGAVAFTDGDRAISDALVMRRALAYAATFDRLVVHVPQESSLSADGDMNEGEMATRLGLAGIPAVAELIMLERDLRLVELTGARYHASKISTAAAVEAIRAAKRRGLPVTCDTSVPYFMLTEIAVGEYRTFGKLVPPLRREEDRRAVISGLADGTIDAIASDHAPLDQDSKRLPFAQAMPGIVGLETLLPLTLSLVHAGALGLCDAMAAVTVRPAAVLGLEAGRLARGARADLVLIDLDAPGRIDVSRFRSKSKNSPFDGLPVQGKLQLTLARGRRVHEAPSIGEA